MQTRVATDKCSVAKEVARKYANAVVTLSMLPSYRHATLHKVVIDPMERFEPGIVPQNDSSATEEIERWVKSLLTHLSKRHSYLSGSMTSHPRLVAYQTYS
ncbi:hypothetical protein J008_04363 [Cryptococcus neoformans]|nr:hypothetical protein J008_04363 [Cryptococcus neoformans var. grubii]